MQCEYKDVTKIFMKEFISHDYYINYEHTAMRHSSQNFWVTYINNAESMQRFFLSVNFKADFSTLTAFYLGHNPAGLVKVITVAGVMRQYFSFRNHVGNKQTCTLYVACSLFITFITFLVWIYAL